MPVTYSLIASTTLTGSQTNIDFTSIPSTYTDLVLRITARTDVASLNTTARIQLNGDATAVYSSTYLTGDGSAATSTRDTGANRFFPYATGTTATSNTFGISEVYFPNYAGSQKKVVGIFSANESNAATGVNLRSIACLYDKTTAISSINISSTSQFVSGSSFFLYGIKNS